LRSLPLYFASIRRSGFTLLIAFIMATAVAGCIETTQPPPENPTPTPVPTATSTPLPPTATPEPIGFTIDFIDVGQGDATLITAITGETLLIDGGRSRERIRDRLEQIGISDLDAIAMTHPDADHIAGLVEVLALYPIERVYLNGGQSGTATFNNLMTAIQNEGAAVETVTTGDIIALGSLELRVLHPDELTGDSNVDSMVLLLDCQEVEVLLTGDAEIESEEAMIESGLLQDIDVLKVGHHGSRTSSLQAFLDAVRPEAAVISAGLSNQYGHPHAEVIERLNAMSIAVYSTDTTDEADGVRVTSDCQTYSFGAIP
jgi:beta-lactamase superfamily II metal-dependent hydrolase